MTNDQINRMLAVNLFNECWHEAGEPHGEPYLTGAITFHEYYKCKHCGQLLRWPDSFHSSQLQYEWNTNYINEVGFFQLLERAKEQEWWEQFILTVSGYTKEGAKAFKFFSIDYINFKTFPRLLCEFGMEVLGWKP
jgi:hypothetical protein